MDLTTRVNLVRSLRSKTDKPEIPVSVAADLWGINRTSIYYEAKPVSDTERKSRWADNIKIERWFRSFKYEEAYLTEWHNIKEARAAIREYIYTYNFERCHSAIGYVPPASVYYPAMLYEEARDIA